ncbi:MAG: TOBE domain-containing protein, partial [Oscillospiraceae bacterium]|nr:TOBE domain-containing protein [Oscillospiraceae bacterium]
GDTRVNQKLRFAIRGEHVELTPDAGRPFPGRHMAGVVSGKSFSGGILRVTVLLGGGAEITASRHGIDFPIECGSRAFVSWAPEHTVPLGAGHEG